MAQQQLEIRTAHDILVCHLKRCQNLCRNTPTTFIYLVVEANLLRMRCKLGRTTLYRRVTTPHLQAHDSIHTLVGHLVEPLESKAAILPDKCVLEIGCETPMNAMTYVLL